MQICTAFGCRQEFFRKKWVSLSNIASRQWTMLVVKISRDIAHGKRHSRNSEWHQCHCCEKKPKRTKSISIALPGFRPVSLSEFFVRTSLPICNVIGSISLAPSVAKKIEDIRHQHNASVKAYRIQNDVKGFIDSSSDGGAYRDAWHGLRNTHPLLERFISAATTIFARHIDS